MFRKLNLRTKLFLLCLLISGVVVAVGATGIVSQSHVADEYDFVVNKVVVKSSKASQLLLAYRRIRINITNLGLPDLPATAVENSLKLVTESIEAYDKTAKDYVSLGFVPGQKELYDTADIAWLDFKETSHLAMKLNNSGLPTDREKMLGILISEFPQKAQVYTDAIGALLKFHENVLQNRVENAESIAKNAKTFMLIIIFGGVSVGLLFGFLFANTLSKSLATISEAVRSAAEQTSAGGTQLAAASVQLASGSTEAAASLEETVASIEELSSMVKNNTGHSHEANSLSKASRDSAEKGEVEVSKLISSMTEIANGSKKIEEIIKVIDDIAFQTNLLALNAAVEAARAGEQGKGFAVVAEAVRTLAQRSAVAAKDISSLINENVSKSENGAKIASQSGAVFKEILSSVKKVTDLNGEIASGSKEQSDGLEQISKAMNQLDQATQGNAASSEEVAASSEEMSKQARALSGLVDELQIIIHGAA